MKPVVRTSIHKANPVLTEFKTRFDSVSSNQKEFYKAFKTVMLQLVKDQRINIERQDTEFVKTLLENINQQYYSTLLNSLVEKQSAIVDEVFSDISNSGSSSTSSKKPEEKTTIDLDSTLPFLLRKVDSIINQTILEVRKKIDAMDHSSTNEENKALKEEKESTADKTSEATKESNIEAEVAARTAAIDSIASSISSSFKEFKTKHIAEVNSMFSFQNTYLKKSLFTSLNGLNPGQFQRKTNIINSTVINKNTYNTFKKNEEVKIGKTPSTATAAAGGAVAGFSFGSFFKNIKGHIFKTKEKQEKKLHSSLSPLQQMGKKQNKHSPFYHVFDLFMPIGIILGLFKGIGGLLSGIFKIGKGIVKGVVGVSKFLGKTLYTGLNLLVLKPLKLTSSLLGKFFKKFGLKKLLINIFKTSAGAFILGFAVGAIIKFGLNVYQKVLDWANGVIEKVREYGRAVRAKLEETMVGRWFFSIVDRELDVFKHKGFKGIFEDFEQYFTEDLVEQIITFLSWAGGVFQAVQATFKDKVRDEIAKAVGGAAGGIIGAALGTFIPIPVVGSMIGGFVGSWLGELAGPYVAKGISWINGNYYREKGKALNELQQYSIDTNQGSMAVSKPDNLLLEFSQQGADLRTAISENGGSENDLSERERAMLSVTSLTEGEDFKGDSTAITKINDMILEYKGSLHGEADTARKLVVDQQKGTNIWMDTGHPELFTTCDFTSKIPWTFEGEPNEKFPLAGGVASGTYAVQDGRRLNFPMFKLARTIMLRTLMQDWESKKISDPRAFISMWNSLADPKSKLYNYKWIKSASSMSETDASFKRMFMQRPDKKGQSLAHVPNAYFQIYNDDTNFANNYSLGKDRVYYENADSRSNVSSISGNEASQYIQLGFTTAKDNFSYSTDQSYNRDVKSRFNNYLFNDFLPKYGIKISKEDRSADKMQKYNTLVDSVLGEKYESFYRINASGSGLTKDQQTAFLSMFHNNEGFMKLIGEQAIGIFFEGMPQAKEFNMRLWPEDFKRPNEETATSILDAAAGPAVQPEKSEMPQSAEKMIDEGAVEAQEEQRRRDALMSESAQLTEDSMQVAANLESQGERLSNPDVHSSTSASKIERPPRGLANKDSGSYNGYGTTRSSVMAPGGRVPIPA